MVWAVSGLAGTKMATGPPPGRRAAPRASPPSIPTQPLQPTIADGRLRNGMRRGEGVGCSSDTGSYPARPCRFLCRFLYPLPPTPPHPRPLHRTGVAYCQIRKSRRPASRPGPNPSPRNKSHLPSKLKVRLGRFKRRGGGSSRSSPRPGFYLSRSRTPIYAT